MYEKLVYPEYSGRVLTMVGEDDAEIQCSVLLIYKLNEEATQKYIALLQIIDGEETENLSILRFEEEDNTPVLNNIEDDEEFSKAAEFLGDYLDYMQAQSSEGTNSCGCSHEHGGPECRGCH